MAKDKKIKTKNSPNQKKALGLINIPAKCTSSKQTYERIACVFQGGGALGAYQVGAFRAIHERGYHPNFIAGVSIGSINSAIIAGNAPADQLDKLTEFWDTIAPKVWSDPIDHEFSDIFHHFHNQIGALQSLIFGL